MTSVALCVAKSSNDQITEWTSAEENLKTAIVESLGPVVRQIVKHPQHGFTLLSIQDIMARVRNRYGKMRKNTRKNLEEKMSSRLASTDSFETHVSHLREHFLTVEKGGHPILEDKRVEILKKSLSGHAIIEKILTQYDFNNSDEGLQTFEDIVEYIDDHLPNLQSSAQMAADTTANIMMSEAYVALEAEVQKPKEARVKEKTKSQRKTEQMVMAHPRPNPPKGPGNTATCTALNTRTHPASVNSWLRTPTDSIPHCETPRTLNIPQEAVPRFWVR
jgi:hypothetical protein